MDIAGAVNLLREWGPFLILSAVFFNITAGTFASLGVALPYMIEEMSWTWSQAGAGFSLLALLVGLAALAPAWIIRRWGIGASFLIGGASMVLGYCLFATTNGLPLYFVGAALTGFGYPLCAMVPAMDYFNKAFDAKKRGAVVGAYLMIGGLGGVAGPLLVTSIVELTGVWRYHWWLAAAITVVLTVLVVAFVRDKQLADHGKDEAEDNAPTDPRATTRQWEYREVIRTGQFYVIVCAMTLTLFCGLTMNSWTVTHMNSLGVTTAVAAGALSAHALINALSRGVGGAMARWVDPKWLLVSAIAAELIGMLALARADNMVMIAIFAIGEGYGFGMCLFSTTLLLVNYYGTAKNPEVLGSMHFATTLAMFGPVVAGAAAERTGGFGGVFVGYAAVLAIVLIAAILMRPPVHKGEQAAAAAST